VDNGEVCYDGARSSHHVALDLAAILPATDVNAVTPTRVIDTRDEPSGWPMPAVCGLPATEWTTTAHPDSNEIMGPWASGSYVTGDLTRDGASDFAWATVCGLVTVAADRDVHVFNSDRRFPGTLPVEATVRAVHPGRTVDALDPRISGGRIRVEVWVWHTSDPTCCPSSAFDLSDEWNGSRIVATSTVPTPSTGATSYRHRPTCLRMQTTPSLAFLASRAPHQLVGCFTVSTGAYGCTTTPRTRSP
jgi:hypothetical protein